MLLACVICGCRTKKSKSQIPIGLCPTLKSEELHLLHLHKLFKLCCPSFVKAVVHPSTVYFELHGTAWGQMVAPPNPHEPLAA